MRRKVRINYIAGYGPNQVFSNRVIGSDVFQLCNNSFFYLGTVTKTLLYGINIKVERPGRKNFINIECLGDGTGIYNSKKV
jgi:hypothetical protein